MPWQIEWLDAVLKDAAERKKKVLLVFSLPIIVTNTISILFHAADVAVLAFFAEDADVAACLSLLNRLYDTEKFVGFIDFSPGV